MRIINVFSINVIISRNKIGDEAETSGGRMSDMGEDQEIQASSNALGWVNVCGESIPVLGKLIELFMKIGDRRWRIRQKREEEIERKKQIKEDANGCDPSLDD